VGITVGERSDEKIRCDLKVASATAGIENVAFLSAVNRLAEHVVCVLEFFPGKHTNFFVMKIS
jgi:hypothetical protein